MKKLKKFLIELLLFLVAIVIIAFFLPRQVHVERQGVIDAPAKVVFNQINNLRSWNKWAVWNQIDPNMRIKYQNNGIGENASYTWESDNKNVGSGKLTITASVPYDSIATEMDFMEEGIATGYFLFDEQNGKTTITWAFDTDLGNNPFARWMGLMFDAMIGPDFKKGIENLKIVSETIVQEKRPIVELVTVPEFSYVSIRKHVQLEDISTQMGIYYGQLMQFINDQGLLRTDMPYAIYHQIDGTLVDLECGIPVDGTVVTEGEISSGKMPQKTYAEADHFGSYSNLEKTHNFIQQWITDNNFTLTGGPMEKYLTDPQQVPDESKWVTGVYYPVR